MWHHSNCFISFRSNCCSNFIVRRPQARYRSFGLHHKSGIPGTLSPLARQVNDTIIVGSTNHSSAAKWCRNVGLFSIFSLQWMILDLQQQAKSRLQKFGVWMSAWAIMC